MLFHGLGLSRGAQHLSNTAWAAAVRAQDLKAWRGAEVMQLRDPELMDAIASAGVLREDWVPQGLENTAWGHAVLEQARGARWHAVARWMRGSSTSLAVRRWWSGAPRTVGPRGGL